MSLSGDWETALKIISVLDPRSALPLRHRTGVSVEEVLGKWYSDFSVKLVVLILEEVIGVEPQLPDEFQGAK
jgi:hypothetical protein